VAFLTGRATGRDTRAASPQLLKASAMPLSPLFRPEASLDDLMAFAGEKYALEFEQVRAGGVCLDILQIANMREILDRAVAAGALADAVHTLPLWAKIWPASVILSHVVASLPKEGRNVLEIGAGCGLAGLMAAACGFERVVISDINDDALLFARINILKNGLEKRAEVRRLDIRDAASQGERFSLILASEILYLDYLYRPLVKLLKRGLKPLPEKAEANLASDHRRGAGAFFKRAEKEFHIQHKRIGARESVPQDGDNARPERHLLTLHRLTPLF
jgi:predicted nicotinamide N-methyase